MARMAILATALAALVAAWGPWSPLQGTLAGHMLQHLVAMNVAALLLAVALRPKLQGMLALSTVLQKR